MRILLVPLDERPVNVRYPQMTAAIAGATVITPPSAILSKRRQPADREALSQWLRETAPTCDATVICLETLAYGGLIASRTSHEPAWEVLSRLSVLRELPRPMYVANLITRVNRDNNSTEEPDYWREYGSLLFQFSNRPDDEQFAASIPADIRHDFLWRRARNHAVNQAVLTDAANFDLLVIASDDTDPRGMPARERAQLAALRDRLNLTDQVLMYPGADELGCTLVARLLNRERACRVFVDYAIPGGDQVTAKYEDRAVCFTVEGQLAAVGGVWVESPSEADLILAINPPSEAGQEWELVDAQHERETRTPFIKAAIQRIKQALESGQRVAVADVAYPNGADPILIEQLLHEIPIAQLAAYGAWNTAGNTLGSVLAAATVPVRDEAARRLYLAHRFLEDWGYQHLIRQEIRTRYDKTDPRNLELIRLEIEQRLDAPLMTLAACGLPYKQHEVVLPWQRTFEIDFRLQPAPR